MLALIYSMIGKHKGNLLLFWQFVNITEDNHGSLDHADRRSDIADFRTGNANDQFLLGRRGGSVSRLGKFLAPSFAHQRQDEFSTFKVFFRRPRVIEETG